MPDFESDPLLRKRTILQQVPVHESTLWQWIKEGTFPKPVILNAGQKREIIAWRLSDFVKWRDGLPQRLAITGPPSGSKRGRPRKQLVTRPKE